MRAPLALAASVAAVAIAPLAAEQAEQQEPQQEQEESMIEEIVVTGTHIRGADIGGMLPVSVFSADDIDAFGVDSGDELLELLPEQGQNFFNEAENISGGVNSARGDIGAFNLRNLGTGNTLVLLNGRRLVNAASYQTEEVGGSFVPVNTVNSNTIPVYGVERVEVLKDGASAVYGADAVAGVVNHVLQSDFRGFRVRARYGWYERLDRKPVNLDFAWGGDFNGGRTNLSVMGSWQSRGRVRADEDPRWATGDLRAFVDESSLWDGDTRLRNTSAHSLYGQFDVVPSASRSGVRHLTDGAGEFEVYPAGDERCEWALNDRLCGAPDGQGTERYNLNGFRDVSAELDRRTLFAFLNHDFDNGLESFSEFMLYQSDTNLRRHASYSFTSVRLRVGAQNYYNPFGPCGSPNRLPESVIPDVPCEGLDLTVDNYRYAEVPRIVDNSGTVYRLLQGLRGSAGEWDWEAAVLHSKATREDITRNRVSNTLMVEALRDSTSAAYNPFAEGVNSNLERALVDVYRDNEMSLSTVDFQLNRDGLFEMPAGPVGFAAGAELRRESFEDDRDPRLDGTIAFTDFDGDTFPFVSDVVNSSPTPDNSGSRNVASVFAELHIPLFESVDVQAAVRYESFSDVGDTVVGKIAGGWRPHDAILLRASWSQAFRAPNLVTVNETIVARQNPRNDYACIYAANAGGDPGQDIVDCRNSVQRTARGSDALESERSDNASLGVVLEPVDGLTFTLDYWSIEKTDTIGLFGEENHTVLDALLRLQHGAGNCSALQANPAVVRDAEVDEDVAAVYRAAGVCPAGDVLRVNDRYANLDTRTLKGFDTSLSYRFEVAAGTFNIRYTASFLDTFEQAPGGEAAGLLAAKDAGTLPASIPVRGFDDLIYRNGNQKQKHNLRVSWSRGPLGASLSGVRIGKLYQESLTLDCDDVPSTLSCADDTGLRWWLAPMTTLNATVDYTMDWRDADVRMRFGARNLTDERAPLADRYFGYLADAHQDYGRNFYLDLRMTRR